MRRVQFAAEFPNGDALPVVVLSGIRVTITATDTSSAAVALPVTGALIVVRATKDIWIRFGTSGVGVAAANDDSMLFPAGVEAVVQRAGDTHFRVIRAGTEDALVQLEKVEVQSG